MRLSRAGQIQPVGSPSTNDAEGLGLAVRVLAANVGRMADMLAAD